MSVLQFIFADVWHFFGVLLLVGVIGEAITQWITAWRKP